VILTPFYRKTAKTSINKSKLLLWRLRICRNLATPSRRTRSLPWACTMHGMAIVSIQRQKSSTLQTFYTRLLRRKCRTWHNVYEWFPAERGSGSVHPTGCVRVCLCVSTHDVAVLWLNA